MKKLVLILSLVVCGVAWAQGDPEAGKEKAATCAACHGADGNSILPTYPNLAGQHPGYLKKQLLDYQAAMRSGGEKGRQNAVMGGMAMPLSEQDVLDLSAYFASLPAADGTTAESSVVIAEPLYRYGDRERGIAACGACHGPRGNGSQLSGFPRISGQQAEYIEAQLKMFRDGTRNNDMNAMMQSVAGKLTDGEISALAQYLGGLH